MGELYTQEEMKGDNASSEATKGDEHPHIAPCYVESIKYLNSIVADPVKRKQITADYQKMVNINNEDMINGKYDPNQFKEFAEGYKDGIQQQELHS